ncbi:MgtC/SapB family protein [soil metagenome]
MIIEPLVAFALTSLIGLEREIQGKSAGLRTQAIVGTSAALILLVNKYGFQDVPSPGTVEVDPSRVAAQIVSGIGFLGAGLIFAPVARRLNARLRGTVQLHLTYIDNLGVMRQVLQICDRHHWQLTELSGDRPSETAVDTAGQVGVTMTLTGSGILAANTLLAQIKGVTALRQLDEAAE